MKKIQFLIIALCAAQLLNEPCFAKIKQDIEIEEGAKIGRNRAENRGNRNNNDNGDDGDNTNEVENSVNVEPTQIVYAPNPSYQGYEPRTIDQVY